MIIFYRGQDTYRLRVAVANLKVRLTDAHPALTSNEAIDVSEEDGLIALEHALKYPSLFQQTSFLVVRNVLANADIAQSFQKLLQSYDVTNNADTFLIACHEGPVGRDSAAAKALTTYLSKHASEHASFDILEGSALTAWMIEFCRTRRCTIDPQASALLAQRTIGDGWALACELEKACAYADGGMIRSGTVSLLTADRPERDEFQLSNALTVRDKRAAITALWSRLREGAPAQLLLGALAYSLRTLLSVRDLAGRGLSQGDIARKAGIAPFVVSKTLRGVSAYAPGALERAHHALASLDTTSKEGLADIDDGLQEILLEL